MPTILTRTDPGGSTRETVAHTPTQEVNLRARGWTPKPNPKPNPAPTLEPAAAAEPTVAPDEPAPAGPAAARNRRQPKTDDTA